MTRDGGPLLTIVLVAAAGALVAAQVAINGRLRIALGSPGASALASLVVGMLALAPLVVSGLLGPVRADGAAQAPWWAWLGGICGALYLTAAALAAPRLGTALTLGALLAGQVAAGLLIDTLGLLGAAQLAPSPARLAGATLILGGVTLLARSPT